MNIVDVLIKMFMGASGGGSFANPVEISQQIFGQLKKVLKSLIILLICSVLFCLLMGYLIDRILNQMDQGAFAFTNSIIFLIALIIINLVVMAWSLKKASAKDEVVTKTVVATEQNSFSPLEAAIAALILDFIKDRENKRESEKKVSDTV